MRRGRQRVRGIQRAVRSRAIARGRHAGVKFVHSGSNGRYTLDDDGNGNGIANADISTGIDRRYSGPAHHAAVPHRSDRTVA